MPNAFYRFEANVIGRSSGKQSSRSVVFASAYRAGEKLHFEREGIDADYSGKRGILETGILAPADSPGWIHDRGQLWNEVERREARKDAQLARELQIALPDQLSGEQRREALTSFLEREVVSKGMVADFAIHAPSHKGDERNHHAHVLLTMRPIEDGQFGNKAREWNSPELLIEWREAWAKVLNQTFEKHRVTDAHGVPLRVDHRSYADQGLDIEPGVHLGPAATALERKGIPTERGDINREVSGRNAEIIILKRQAERLEARMIELKLGSTELSFFEDRDRSRGHDGGMNL